MKKNLFLLFFILFSCNWAAAQQDTVLAKGLKTARALLNKEQYDEAFATLKGLYKTNTDAFIRDSIATTLLGTCYNQGLGTIKDEDAAVRWLTIGSALGNPKAMNAIAVMYYNGGVFKQDKKQALKYFKQASDKGNAFGMASLGQMYMSGEGTKKDTKEGLRLLRESAENGEPSAYFYLAEAFDGGIGVTVDYGEAAKLFKKAADKGYMDAYSEVALLYLKGVGVPQDDEKGCAWATKALNAGTAGGQCVLGICYRDGLCGKPVDIDKSNELIDKAAERGNKQAFRLRAKRRSEEWRAAQNAATEAAEAAQERANTQYAGNNNNNNNNNQAVTMSGLVAYIKESAPKSGYRQIVEEGKAAAGSYSYNLGVSYKVMVVLIIPYNITNRTPTLKMEHLNNAGQYDFSYNSDFSDVKVYDNMTMIKMTLEPKLGVGFNYRFRLSDGGYFMILTD
jgi:TPR repeat protein